MLHSSASLEVNACLPGLNRFVILIYLLDAAIGTSPMLRRQLSRLPVLEGIKLLYGPVVCGLVFVLAAWPACGVFPQFQNGKTLVASERPAFRLVRAEALAVLVASVLILSLVACHLAHPAPVGASVAKPQLVIGIRVPLVLVQVPLDPDLLNSFLQVLPRL